ncbi:hypothetical protein DPMN_041233 [Dreissena polymorpha]|uniref:Uncharacterized protein n=1 Tax=Dreissena polymorpha TaxID=45954 RepID=A0A9D4HXP3_DREPO|nr:hypothetical protein DPMN_041233 [Dreissena polymorpha]
MLVDSSDYKTSVTETFRDDETTHNSQRTNDKETVLTMDGPGPSSAEADPGTTPGSCIEMIPDATAPEVPAINRSLRTFLRRCYDAMVSAKHPHHILRMTEAIKLDLDMCLISLENMYGPRWSYGAAPVVPGAVPVVPGAAPVVAGRCRSFPVTPGSSRRSRITQRRSAGIILEQMKILGSSIFKQAFVAARQRSEGINLGLTDADIMWQGYGGLSLLDVVGKLKTWKKVA